MEIERIIEKPPLNEEPSDIALFGRYILQPEIPDILSRKQLGKDNELWLNDAITTYIKEGGHAYAQPVKDGFWYTTGDPLNYMKASLEYALARDDMNSDLKEYIRGLRI